MEYKRQPPLFEVHTPRSVKQGLIIQSFTVCGELIASDSLLQDKTSQLILPTSTLDSSCVKGKRKAIGTWSKYLAEKQTEIYVPRYDEFDVASRSVESKIVDVHKHSDNGMKLNDRDTQIKLAWETSIENTTTDGNICKTNKSGQKCAHESNGAGPLSEEDQETWSVNVKEDRANDPGINNSQHDANDHCAKTVNENRKKFPLFVDNDCFNARVDIFTGRYNGYNSTLDLISNGIPEIRDSCNTILYVDGPDIAGEISRAIPPVQEEQTSQSSFDCRKEAGAEILLNTDGIGIVDRPILCEKNLKCKWDYSGQSEGSGLLKYKKYSGKRNRRYNYAKFKKINRTGNSIFHNKDKKHVSDTDIGIEDGNIADDEEDDDKFSRQTNESDSFGQNVPYFENDVETMGRNLTIATDVVLLQGDMSEAMSQNDSALFLSCQADANISQLSDEACRVSEEERHVSHSDCIQGITPDNLRCDSVVLNKIAEDNQLLIEPHTPEITKTIQSIVDTESSAAENIDSSLQNIQCPNRTVECFDENDITSVDMSVNKQHGADYVKLCDEVFVSDTVTNNTTTENVAIEKNICESEQMRLLGEHGISVDMTSKEDKIPDTEMVCLLNVPKESHDTLRTIEDNESVIRNTLEHSDDNLSDSPEKNPKHTFVSNGSNNSSYNNGEDTVISVVDDVVTGAYHYRIQKSTEPDSADLISFLDQPNADFSLFCSTQQFSNLKPVLLQSNKEQAITIHSIECGAENDDAPGNDLLTWDEIDGKDTKINKGGTCEIVENNTECEHGEVLFDTVDGLTDAQFETKGRNVVKCNTLFDDASGCHSHWKLIHDLNQEKHTDNEYLDGSDLTYQFVQCLLHDIVSDIPLKCTGTCDMSMCIYENHLSGSLAGSTIESDIYCLDSHDERIREDTSRPLHTACNCSDDNLHAHYCDSALHTESDKQILNEGIFIQINATKETLENNDNDILQLDLNELQNIESRTLGNECVNVVHCIQYEDIPVDQVTTIEPLIQESQTISLVPDYHQAAISALSPCEMGLCETLSTSCERYFPQNNQLEVMVNDDISSGLIANEVMQFTDTNDTKKTTLDTNNDGTAAAPSDIVITKAGTANLNYLHHADITSDNVPEENVVNIERVIFETSTVSDVADSCQTVQQYGAATLSDTCVGQCEMSVTDIHVVNNTYNGEMVCEVSNNRNDVSRDKFDFVTDEQDDYDFIWSIDEEKEINLLVNMAISNAAAYIKVPRNVQSEPLFSPQSLISDTKAFGHHCDISLEENQINVIEGDCPVTPQDVDPDQAMNIDACDNFVCHSVDSSITQDDVLIFYADSRHDTDYSLSKDDETEVYVTTNNLPETLTSKTDDQNYMREMLCDMCVDLSLVQNDAEKETDGSVDLISFAEKDKDEQENALQYCDSKEIVNVFISDEINTSDWSNDHEREVDDMIEWVISKAVSDIYFYQVNKNDASICDSSVLYPTAADMNKETTDHNLNLPPDLFFSDDQPRFNVTQISSDAPECASISISDSSLEIDPVTNIYDVVNETQSVFMDESICTDGIQEGQDNKNIDDINNHSRGIDIAGEEKISYTCNTTYIMYSKNDDTSQVVKNIKLHEVDMLTVQVQANTMEKIDLATLELDMKGTCHVNPYTYAQELSDIEVGYEIDYVSSNSMDTQVHSVILRNDNDSRESDVCKPVKIYNIATPNDVFKASDEEQTNNKDKSDISGSSITQSEGDFQQNQNELHVNESQAIPSKNGNRNKQGELHISVLDVTSSENRNTTNQDERQISELDVTLPNVDNTINQDERQISELDVTLPDDNNTTNQDELQISMLDVTSHDDGDITNQDELQISELDVTLSDDGNTTNQDERQIRDLDVTLTDNGNTTNQDERQISVLDVTLPDDNNTTNQDERQISGLDVTLPDDGNTTNQDERQISVLDVTLPDDNNTTNQDERQISELDVTLPDNGNTTNQYERQISVLDVTLPDDNNTTNEDERQISVLDVTLPDDNNTTNQDERQISELDVTLPDNGNTTNQYERQISVLDVTLPDDTNTTNQNERQISELDVTLPDDNNTTNEDERQISVLDVTLPDDNNTTNEDERQISVLDVTLPDNGNTTNQDERQIRELDVTLPDNGNTTNQDERQTIVLDVTLPDDNNTTNENERQISELDVTLPDDDNTTNEDERQISVLDVTLPDDNNTTNEDERQISEVDVTLPDNGNTTNQDERQTSELDVTLPDDNNTTNQDERQISELDVTLPDDNNTTNEDERQISELDVTLPDDGNTTNQDERHISVLDVTLPDDTNTTNEDERQISVLDVTLPDDNNTTNEDELQISELDVTLPDDNNTTNQDERHISVLDVTLPDDNNTTNEDERQISELDVTLPDDNNTTNEDERQISVLDVTLPDDNNTINEDERQISVLDVTLPDDNNTIDEDECQISELDVTPPDDDNTTNEDELQISELDVTPPDDNNTTHKDERQISVLDVTLPDDNNTIDEDECQISELDVTLPDDNNTTHKDERQISVLDVTLPDNGNTTNQDERQISELYVTLPDDNNTTNEDERQIGELDVTLPDDNNTTNQDERQIGELDVTLPDDNNTTKQDERQVSELDVALPEELQFNETYIFGSENVIKHDMSESSDNLLCSQIHSKQDGSNNAHDTSVIHVPLDDEIEIHNVTSLMTMPQSKRCTSSHNYLEKETQKYQDLSERVITGGNPDDYVLCRSKVYKDIPMSRIYLDDIIQKYTEEDVSNIECSAITPNIYYGQDNDIQESSNPHLTLEKEDSEHPHNTGSIAIHCDDGKRNNRCEYECQSRLHQQNTMMSCGAGVVVSSVMDDDQSQSQTSHTLTHIPSDNSHVYRHSELSDSSEFNLNSDNLLHVREILTEIIYKVMKECDSESKRSEVSVPQIDEENVLDHHEAEQGTFEFDREVVDKTDDDSHSSMLILNRTFEIEGDNLIYDDTDHILRDSKVVNEVKDLLKLNDSDGKETAGDVDMWIKASDDESDDEADGSSLLILNKTFEIDELESNNTDTETDQTFPNGPTTNSCTIKQIDEEVHVTLGGLNIQSLIDETKDENSDLSHAILNRTFEVDGIVPPNIESIETSQYGTLIQDSTQTPASIVSISQQPGDEVVINNKPSNTETLISKKRSPKVSKCSRGRSGSPARPWVHKVLPKHVIQRSAVCSGDASQAFWVSWDGKKQSQFNPTEELSKRDLDEDSNQLKAGQTSVGIQCLRLDWVLQDCMMMGDTRETVQEHTPQVNLN